MAKPLPFTVYHRAGREMSLGHISCRKNLYLWHCCCISSEAIYPSVFPPPPSPQHTHIHRRRHCHEGGGEGKGATSGYFSQGIPSLPSPFQRPRQRRLRREGGGGTASALGANFAPPREQNEKKYPPVALPTVPFSAVVFFPRWYICGPPILFVPSQTLLGENPEPGIKIKSFFLIVSCVSQRRRRRRYCCNTESPMRWLFFKKKDSARGFGVIVFPFRNGNLCFPVLY